MIKSQLASTFTKIQKLTAKEQITQYNRLLQTINAKLKSSALSEKDRVLTNLIKEVILEARSTVK